jgi:hypothetical protein
MASSRDAACVSWTGGGWGVAGPRRACVEPRLRRSWPAGRHPWAAARGSQRWVARQPGSPRPGCLRARRQARATRTDLGGQADTAAGVRGACALAQCGDPRAIERLADFWRTARLSTAFPQAVLINLGASPARSAADVLVEVGAARAGRVGGGRADGPGQQPRSKRPTRAGRGGTGGEGQLPPGRAIREPLEGCRAGPRGEKLVAGKG